MAECIRVQIHYKMFVIYALSILYDLQSSAVSVFSKEFLEDHDILFHTQCPYALEDSIPLLQFGLQVTYYAFQVESILYNPFMQKGVRNFKQPSVVLICPANISELFLYLEAIASVAGAKTVAQQPMYVLQWPNSTCLSTLEKGFPSNLQDNAILQRAIKRYPMDSDIYLSFACENFSRSKASRMSLLLELYSVHKVVAVIQPLLINLSQQPLISEDIVNKIKRRSNFHGVTIRGAYYRDPSINSKTSFEVMIELMQFVAEYFNFTLTNIRGKGWIGNKNNFPTTGMGQQLLNGEIDIITQNSELTPFRMQYFKPFQPVYYYKLSAIFRQPPASLFRNIYITSFSMPLWRVILLSWFTILCSKKAIMFVKKVFRVRSNFDAIAVDNDVYGGGVILWLISSITLQGWHLPMSQSFKIIHISTLIFALVCYTVYAASIISTLSNQKGPILHYDQLVKSNMPFVADRNILNAMSALETLFEKQNLSKNETIDKFVDVIDGYNIIKNYNYALLTYKELWFQRLSATSPVTVQDVCEPFTYLPINDAMPGYAGVMLRLNSSLREYLSFPFVALFQSGLRNKFMKTYITTNSPRCLKYEKQPEQFDVNDVFLVYMVLLTGFLASIAFLIKERFCDRIFSH